MTSGNWSHRTRRRDGESVIRGTVCPPVWAHKGLREAKGGNTLVHPAFGELANCPFAGSFVHLCTVEL